MGIVSDLTQKLVRVVKGLVVGERAVIYGANTPKLRRWRSILI